MKTNDNNNLMPENPSLLKSVDNGCDVDPAFLERLREQSVEAFEQASQAGDSPPTGIRHLWRHFMKNRMMQLTSAAAVVIVALFAGYMFIGSGTNVTFAKAVKPLINATTLSYDFIIGNEQDGVVIKEILVGNRIHREIGKTVQILDLENQKMLTLDTTKKEAVYIDLKGALKFGTERYVQFIRETVNGALGDPKFTPEELGEKEIDGYKAIGFRCGNSNEQIVIWADADTATPVQIELLINRQLFIFKHFEFDIPVDASQISMEVPAGYTLKETDIDLSHATEEDFIAGLRIWIEVILDDRFPQAITTEAYMKTIPVLKQKVGELNLPADQAEQLIKQFIKGMMFINLFPAEGRSDLHYAGANVLYGDRDTPVFWYRPKDSKNYRVIYGDLTVEEMSENQLPK